MFLLRRQAPTLINGYPLTSVPGQPLTFTWYICLANKKDPFPLDTDRYLANSRTAVLAEKYYRGQKHISSIRRLDWGVPFFGIRYRTFSFRNKSLLASSCSILHQVASCLRAAVCGGGAGQPTSDLRICVPPGKKKKPY